MKGRIGNDQLALDAAKGVSNFSVYGIEQELITMKTVDLSIRDVAHYIWDGSGPDFVHSLLITEQPVSFMAFLCSCASILNIAS